MLVKRALAGIAAALLLSACSSAAPTTTTRATPAANPQSGPVVVLDQAREVADQLNQREAELESIAP
jgi:uncharacterized lipoprotein YmbA